MAKFQIKYLYPLLLAAFPVLALFVNNYGEVGWDVVPRPLFIAMGMASLVLLIFWLLLKNWSKAALMSAWFVILFFLYGYLRNFLLENFPEFGRQRFLIPVWILVIIGSLYLFWRLKKIEVITKFTSIVSLAGIAILAIQIIWIQINIWKFQNEIYPIEQTAELSITADAPDIYYIILDSYTRSDILEEQFSLNNSEFLNLLENRNFYIAACSNANYPNTYESIASSLNSNYLTEVIEEFNQTNLPSSVFGKLITDGWVENSLSKAGYTIVGHETEFAWLNNKDADIYYPKLLNPINSYEFMLINRSSAVILWDLIAKLFPYVNGFDLRAWVQNQLNILDFAQMSVELDSPKYVFIHIAIPHQPYVFQLDGPIPNMAPGFSREPYLEQNEGYRRQVNYINAKIVPIIDAIINSGKPVVIILQGDHGSRIDNNLYPILNAYYFSDSNGVYPDLNRSTSPVNTFRIIFNRYFGTDLEILPDKMLGDLKYEIAPLCDKDAFN